MVAFNCRRGESTGLKWDKIDMDRRRVKIDAAFLYSVERGVYESTAKARDVLLREKGIKTAAHGSNFHEPEKDFFEVVR